jgi:hypothetical protein
LRRSSATSSIATRTPSGFRAAAAELFAITVAFVDLRFAADTLTKASRIRAIVETRLAVMIVINTPTDYEMQGQRESGLP